MKDALGRKLLNSRKKKITPLIRGRLLDVGCGTNVIVQEYKKNSGREAVGIDVYPWAGADMVVKNTAQLPFADDYFDTVICVATLNHIPNREDVIEEMGRVLKKDGHLVVTMLTPGVSRIWHALRKPWDADQKERGMKRGEVFGFSRSGIIRLFSSRFRLVATKYFMCGFNRVYIFQKQP